MWPNAARRLVALALLALCALAPVAGLGGPDAPPRTHPYPSELPPGPGHDLAARACVVCHSAMLITQQAKDSTGWEKTLATMQKWGAPLTPAEHDTLRGYLVARFGPRRAR